MEDSTIEQSHVYFAVTFVYATRQLLLETDGDPLTKVSEHASYHTIYIAWESTP